jgi:hypothetical protein
MKKQKFIDTKIFSSSVYYIYKNKWVKLFKNIMDNSFEKNNVFNLKKDISNNIETYNFSDYITSLSLEILNLQGYDLKNYTLKVNELLLNKFSTTRIFNEDVKLNPNSHISGYYFLESNDKTPYPLFHDPRPSKAMVQLPQKNVKEVNESSDKIRFNAIPGSLILFNSYIPCELPRGSSLDPFSFISFNLQAYPNKFLR